MDQRGHQHEHGIALMRITPPYCNRGVPKHSSRAMARKAYEMNDAVNDLAEYWSEFEKESHHRIESC